MSWMVRGTVLERYLAACKEAATNDYAFETFMDNPAITAIFCHTSNAQALEYLNIVNTYCSKHGAVLGNDIVRNHDIQYLAIMVNLVNRFGPLDGLKIVEIGGGYGGQAEMILKNFKPKCYHIVDLFEVGLLQQRYLKATIARTIQSSVMQFDHHEYDLVISNYAYSEVLEPTKTVYRNFMRKIPRGYVTFNTEPDLDWNCNVENDIPGERETNKIVWWTR